MKLCKRIVLAAAALALIFALGACGGEEPKEDGETAGNEVVARIEDREITEKELMEFVELSAFAAGQSLENYQDHLSELRTTFLENMIKYESMRLTLEKEGKDIFPDDYEESLKTFLESSKPALEEANIQVSEETLKYYFSLSYYSEPFSKRVEDQVTEDAMKKEYEENKDAYKATEPMVTASHILVEDEALAKDIYDQIMAGADFAEMAAQYGTDGTEDTGGALGAFTAGTMVEDFSNAVFAMKVGEVSKPVKTEFGYHVIYLTGRIEAGESQPFDWVKDQIKETLLSSKYDEMLEKTMEGYDIEYYGEFKK